MRILLPLAALAACSPPSAPAVAEASATGAPASPREGTTPEEPPRPGELRTFGDWAVGCDNTALCTMTSLLSDTDAVDGPIMTVLRQPGGDGAVDLAFQTRGDDPPVSPVAVAIDGRRIALPALNGPAAARVAAAMASGRTLAVLAPTERTRLSLRGASAALRWIDAQQGRAGTVTALVAKGAKPASAVPPARDAPVIRAVVPSGEPARPDARQLEAMRRFARCDMPAGAGAEPTLAALGGGRTLVVLPCSAGAYNVIAALLVFDGTRFAPARLDAPAGFDATGADSATPVPSVVNATWREGELTSYAKGRGLGDCGLRQTFVWDGARLRLSEQAEMRGCRGNPYFLTTWRAQVVRG